MIARALSAIVDLVQVCRCVSISNTRFRKTRRRAMGPVVAAGNLYMRWADARITMFVRARDWVAYERACFELVHDRPVDVGERSLEFDRLPGESLREVAAKATLSEDALYATGAELNRCHQLSSGQFAHGDPHFGNVLWDGARARLIDFETRYRDEVPIETRRANDLLVLCLDAMTVDPAWPSLANALLAGYAPSRPVRAALYAVLAPPRGLARVLWSSRTKRLAPSTVDRRAAALRATLA